MAGAYGGKSGDKPRRATVSQSRTMWVKKGDVVGGKKVTKGYLAQLGKPEKRVSANVKIETATESGKKAGEVYRYKAGRTVKPTVKVKGSNGKSKNAATVVTPPPSNYKTASRLGKPGEYQAGRGMTSRTRTAAGSVVAGQPKFRIAGPSTGGGASMVGAKGRTATGSPASKASVVGQAREVKRGLSKIDAARRRNYERMWKQIQSGSIKVTKAQEAFIRRILFGR